MATRRADPNRMSFLEHLDELRTRLFIILASVAVLFVVGWFLREPVLDLLMAPVQAHLPEDIRPVYTTLAEPFMLSMKVAFFVGLLLSFPVVVLQVWLFVAPGLYAREKKHAVPFIFFGSMFFFLGSGFGYEVVFPAAVRFLIGFAGDRFAPMLTISRIFSFEMRLILSMGLVFQLPVLIFLLSRLGLVTPGFLWRNFKYAVLIIFVLAAVLTPTPDAVTMTLVAGPMVGLYLAGVLVAVIFGRPRDDSADAGEPHEDEEDAVRRPDAGDPDPPGTGGDGGGHA
ncbi:MAG: twin-arginine translocase subunit TatC [Acidobacteriota bacterium]